jgi:hypothetical protein
VTATKDKNAPADTVKVLVAYSPDKSKVGTTIEVPREQARQMVREGRGALLDDKGNPIDSSAPKVTKVDPFDDKTALEPGEVPNTGAAVSEAEVHADAAAGAAPKGPKAAGK